MELDYLAGATNRPRGTQHIQRCAASSNRATRSRDENLAAKPRSTHDMKRRKDDSSKVWSLTALVRVVGPPVTRCYLCCTPIGGSCTGGTSGITCANELYRPSSARRGSPMHHNTLLRSVLKRTLTVTTLAALTLTAFAATSAAAPVQDATSAARGPTLVGMSMTTFVWMLFGIAVVTGGLIAASRSGRRVSPAADALPSAPFVAVAETTDLGRTALAV